MVLGLDTGSGWRARVPSGRAIAAPAPLGAHLRACEPASIWGQKEGRGWNAG